MAEKQKEKLTSYKVKSPITLGVRNENAEDPTAPGAVEYQDLQPGDTIDLTEKEAYDYRHAIHNPPEMRKAIMDDGEEVDLDDDEIDAIESIRRNPEHPDSGVQPFWKVDQLAIAAANTGAARMRGTKPVGGGFERAQAHPLTQGGPMVGGIKQPESNKTEEDRQAEEARLKEEEKARKEAEKAASKK